MMSGFEIVLTLCHTHSVPSVTPFCTAHLNQFCTECCLEVTGGRGGGGFRDLYPSAPLHYTGGQLSGQPDRPGMCWKRGGGGRGSRTQKFMYQKWPNPVFPSVNFILSHYEIWVPGGTPPPLVTVSRSITALGAAPRCTAPSFLTGGGWVRGSQRMSPQGSWGLNPRLIQTFINTPPSPPQSTRLCNGGGLFKGGGGYNINDLG